MLDAGLPLLRRIFRRYPGAHHGSNIFGSGAPAMDVGRGIEPDLQPGLLHALDGPRVGGQVLPGEADAGDAALRVLAELGQADEEVPQPAPVDVDRSRRRAPEHRRDDHHAEAGEGRPHGFFADGSRLRHDSM